VRQRDGLGDQDGFDLAAEELATEVSGIASVGSEKAEQVIGDACVAGPGERVAGERRAGRELNSGEQGRK